MFGQAELIKSWFELIRTMLFVIIIKHKIDNDIETNDFLIFFIESGI